MVTRKACLISGGGAWGAYGAGTLTRINAKYDVVVGVSTGSLIAPFAALGEWHMLKHAYTSITCKNIFDSTWFCDKPLMQNGKLKKLPIILTILFGRKSIGTSNALRKTIDDFFPEVYYDDLKKLNKEVLVGTQNLAQIPSRIHYFSSMNEEYEDFKDWMWCSANFPFYSSLVNKSWKDNQGNFHIGLWSDGGLTDLVGLDQLFNKGFTEVDIILHRTKNIEKYEGNKINNLIENITTSISALRYDVEFEYFYEKIQQLNKEGVKVTIYWLPRNLSKNSMIFNEKEMIEWWNEGYRTANDKNRKEIFESLKWQ